MRDEFEQVVNGQAPSDRMYGLIELRKFGHIVEYSDKRFQGMFGKLVTWLRRNVGINICDLRTLLSMKFYDVIVAKDEVSTLITLTCRLFGKKIIYMDALFDLPRRKWKRVIYKINLKYADGIVAYSKEQIKTWAKQFTSISPRFEIMPYTIDVQFYRTTPCHGKKGQPYILSIGRDVGRDFKTLVESMDGLGLGLKIVTLPYMLKNVNISHSWIDVLANLPYKDLFDLYAEAALVVIPLKKGVVYPSGIRGLLETMALGKAAICSYSPILEEYAREGEGVKYVEAENRPELKKKINELIIQPKKLIEIGERGRQIVAKNNDTKNFSDAFENYLRRLFNEK
jgi:glycosyltransferase involved in cell wall biosynthesis